MADAHAQRLIGWLGLLLMFLGGVVGASIGPQASTSVTIDPGATLSTVAADTELLWDVGDADPNVGHTGDLRALVWDIKEYDGRVYVAGKFLNVYASNGDQFPQPYLAAFDLETSQWIASFQPQVRGPIYAMDISDDGVILVGGEIPGGVQALDAGTGENVPGFRTDLAHSWGQPTIFDIEVVGSQTYLGGTFVRSGSVPLSNLARISTATGDLDQTWRPTTQLDTVTPRLGGTNVFGIAVDPVRDRVYLAGKFGGINGNSAAFNFATVDTSTGALRADVPQGLPTGILSHRESFSMYQYDVQFRDNRVYVGGQAHQTLVLDAATLTPLRSYSTNRGVGTADAGGDTQTLHVGRTTVWSGCHCWAVVGEYPLGSMNQARTSGHQSYAEYVEFERRLRTVPGSFQQQPVRAAFGIDIVTGDKLPFSFSINGQAGAWAMLEDSVGRLWMGGQFTSDPVAKRPVRGLVRFSPPGTPMPPVDQAPADLIVSYTSEDRLVFAWTPVRGAVRYDVLQDGRVVGTTEDHTWAHRGLRADSSWSYSVRAVMADGRTTPDAAPITASTN